MMADDGRIMTGDPFVEGEPVPFNYKYLMISRDDLMQPS